MKKFLLTEKLSFSEELMFRHSKEIYADATGCEIQFLRRDGLNPTFVKLLLMIIIVGIVTALNFR